MAGLRGHESSEPFPTYLPLPLLHLAVPQLYPSIINRGCNKYSGILRPVNWSSELIKSNNCLQGGDLCNLQSVASWSDTQVITWTCDGQQGGGGRQSWGTEPLFCGNLCYLWINRAIIKLVSNRNYLVWEKTLHIGSGTKTVGALVNLTVMQSFLWQVIPNDPPPIFPTLFFLSLALPPNILFSNFIWTRWGINKWPTSTREKDM